MTCVESINAWACSLPLTHPLRFGSYTVTTRDYAVVQVATTDGIVGEAVGLSRRLPIDVAILDLLAPLLVGQDATHVAARLEDMTLATRAVDQGGVVGMARSLLEICLWDIRGKEAGLPVWRLLGGSPRRLPVLLVEGYSLPDETDDAFADRLAARVAEGYTAFKLEAASSPDARRVAHRLATIRSRVGFDVELVIDLAWSARTAKDVAAAASLWSEYDLAWIEDPFGASRLSEFEALHRLTSVRIGSGDEVSRPAELAELIRKNAVDVVRLDATTIGGMATVGRLAEAAYAAGRRVSMHVHPEIHRHCAFAWSGFDHIERFPSDRPFDREHDLFECPFECRDGQADPPTAAGLGLALDMRVVAGCAYRSGSVARRHPTPVSTGPERRAHRSDRHG